MLESPPPTYDQIADRVRDDLENEKREQMNQEYIASLLERYDVVIEGEDSQADQDAVAEASQ